jgi:hypothetical protein
MLFDNFQGSELFMLPVAHNGNLPTPNEVMAVALLCKGTILWFSFRISTFRQPLGT